MPVAWDRMASIRWSVAGQHPPINLGPDFTCIIFRAITTVNDFCIYCASFAEL